MRRTSLVAALLLALTATACTAPPVERAALPVELSTADLGGMQNRVFDTADGSRVMRAIASTLQDRGYRIAGIDRAGGQITATRGAFTSLIMRQQPAGPGRVRVSADTYVRWDGRDRQVDAAEYYESDLFAPLSRTLGLPALAAPAAPAS